MRNSKVLAVALAIAAIGAAAGGPSVALAQTDTQQSLVVRATPATFTPHVLDGRVNAIVVIGNVTVIGGTFTQLQPAAGGTILARPYLAAFDSTTGALIPGFAPVLNGEVKSLDAVGSSLLVGGAFTLVNAVASRGLTRLNVADGSRVTTFTAKLGDGQVNSLVVRGNVAYVGGRFQTVNGLSRKGLVAVDATTGAVLPLNLPVGTSRVAGVVPSVGRVALSPDGTTLVIGGNFKTLAAQPRVQLALVSLATGTVSSWATSLLAPDCFLGDNTDVNDIAFAPDGSYFVLVTTGGASAGTLCDTASRWNSGRIGAGQVPTWVDSTGGDTLTAVAVTGTAVYVGGHQRWLNNPLGSNTAGPGAITRLGIAALDPATGLPLAWNPGLQRNDAVGDLLATSTGLWIGYDADLIAGVSVPRIAFMPLTGGTLIPRVTPNILPNNLYVAGSDASLTRRSFSGTTFGVSAPVTSPGAVAWDQIVGAFMVTGRIFYGTADGKLWSAAFDGTTVGAPVDTGTWFDFSVVTGMTYDSGRLYYVTGDGKLYYRWFTPSSSTLGGEVFVAAATGYAGTQSLFIAGGHLYAAKTVDQTLTSVALVGGLPSGTSVVISGPAIDGIGWTGKGAFVYSPTGPAFDPRPGHIASNRPGNSAVVMPHRPPVR